MFEIVDFKGKRIMCICGKPDDKSKLYFGIKKAKLIIQHIEDIKKYIVEINKISDMKNAVIK